MRNIKKFSIIGILAIYTALTPWHVAAGRALFFMAICAALTGCGETAENTTELAIESTTIVTTTAENKEETTTTTTKTTEMTMETVTKTEPETTTEDTATAPADETGIITMEDNDNGMDVEERYLINTIIFSDCWSSYQINDFREMGFILNRINHSIWFGYGDFHNNTIEGLWSQIKRHSKNFSVISIEMIDKLYINDSDKIKYLNGWICFSLLLREFEKEKLNKSQK